MDNHEILEKIGQSDMVLAGLGEDFDGSAFLGKDERYLAGCGKLKEAGFRWLPLNGWGKSSGGRIFSQSAYPPTAGRPTWGGW